MAYIRSYHALSFAALFMLLLLWGQLPSPGYSSNLEKNPSLLWRRTIGLNTKSEYPHLVERSAKNIRSASDDEYKAANEKGQLLICYMRDPSSAGDLQYSKYDQWEELKEWGWVESTTTNYLGETAPGISELVGTQDDRSSADKTFIVKHNGKASSAVISSNHEYPPTNAEYNNNLYPEKGVIVAQSSWSPKSQIAEQATSKDSAWNAAVDKPPGLCQWSDVLWLGWVHYTTPEQLSKLRHIAQRNVVSTSTQQVLARVLRKHWPDHETCKTGKAPAWPGKVITPDMEGFAALLGTNSLWGTPFMLIQHHEDDQFGHLEVKNITATTQIISDVFYQPDLILELGPV